MTSDEKELLQNQVCQIEEKLWSRYQRELDKLIRTMYTLAWKIYDDHNTPMIIWHYGKWSLAGSLDVLCVHHEAPLYTQHYRLEKIDDNEHYPYNERFLWITGTPARQVTPTSKLIKCWSFIDMDITL
jgi:hypothetical protein